jgi:molecular chaperone GrpE
MVSLRSGEVKVTDDKRTIVNVGTSSGPGDREQDAETTVVERARSQPMMVGQTEVSGSQESEETSQVDPLEQARKEADENRDRWVRTVAELENYKKRTIQERSRFQKYRYEELLRDLLPIVDNLDRALAHCSEAGVSDGLESGVCIIAGMLRDLLERYGVKEIKALGEPFDPQFHEAIAQVPSPDGRTNVVVEEMERGYLYHDRLLRPARVVVSTDEGQGTSS